MRRLNKMNHFVNDDVFEEVLRFFHELRIQANMSRLVIAASPLRFHPLQEIPRHFDLQLRLPFLDE